MSYPPSHGCHYHYYNKCGLLAVLASPTVERHMVVHGISRNSRLYLSKQFPFFPFNVRRVWPQATGVGGVQTPRRRQGRLLELPLTCAAWTLTA